MLDLALFLWDLLVTFFSIVTKNPWLSVFGKFVTYILKLLLKEEPNLSGCDTEEQEDNENSTHID